MNKLKFILFSLLFLVSILTDTFAQGGNNGKIQHNKPSQLGSCLSLDELQQLLTMPLIDMNHKNPQDFSTFLTSRGYRMGISAQQVDTVWDEEVNYVLLRYTRFPFNDVNNKESYVFVDVSQDSLSNVIHYRRSPVNQCIIRDSTFYNLEYGYDNQRALFIRNEPNRFIYEAYCHNDSNEVVVVLRDIMGIDALVNQKKQETKDYVINEIMQASRLSDSGNFSAAIETLDKTVGLFKPLDFSIRDSKKRINEQFEQYWMQYLDEVITKTDDVDEAIRICDTLLKYGSNKDTIVKMRTVLVERLNGVTQPYSSFHKDIYDSIIKSLEYIVNVEAQSNLNTRMQTLDLSFNFNTTVTNNSFGRVNLSFNDDVHDNTSEYYFGPRLAKLQFSIDSIAGLSLIKPVRQNGVIISTSEQFRTRMDWKYTIYEVRDSCTKKNLHIAPYIKIVDEMYFTGYKSDRKKKAKDGATISSKRNDKPTLALYTFGVNEKYVGDSIYTDVSLLDFKTAGLLSWTPSFLIPGVGTLKQGVISTAASRAVPFYLFGGLAVAGFILEGKNADAPGLFDGGDESLLERKGFGKILGYTCIGISGIIYINDIIEGFSAAVSNHKNAKAIRADLEKRKSIEIQKQEVKLQ